MNQENGGELRLAQMFGRLDGICGQLWDEDRRSAVGLQAVVEEFRHEVGRAEAAVAALRGELARQGERLTGEIRGGFADQLAELEKRLAESRAHAAALEQSLSRERARSGELAARLDAQEQENARLQEEYLKTESQRDAARAERMESFLGELRRKEEQLELKWLERRRALEAEQELRAQEQQKAHIEELRQLKERALELEKELIKKEAELEASNERLRADLEEREARLRRRQDELRAKEKDLERYGKELEDAWGAKRRELDELKRRLQEEIKTVVREYKGQA